MNRFRVIRPLHVVGSIAVVALVSLIVLLIINPGGEGPSADRKPSPSSGSEAPTDPGSSVPAPTGQVMSPEQSQTLESDLDEFVEKFYGRDATLTEVKLRERLTPLVTTSFLDRYPLNLSEESDVWVREKNGKITATASILGSDASLISSRGLIPVEVTVTGKAVGETPPPYTFTIQPEVVWQNQRWKVDSLN